MIEPRTKLGIVFFVVIIALISLIFGFFYYQNKTKTIQPIGQKVFQPNWYKQVTEGQWSQDLKKADDLSREHKPSDAIQIRENVKSQLSDNGQRSIVDLAIASDTFFGIDHQKGAEQYAAIAKTAQYPAISRAYAMLVIADQFSGLHDKNLLKPFFDDQEFASKDGSALVIVLFQRLYDMHRFGLAADKLAVAYIAKIRNNNTISDSDYAVVAGYIADIDKSLAELETTDAFKRFIPVTLLNKAKLFRMIEDMGRPINQPVEDIYLLTIARARLLHISPTEQFGVLAYADYFAQKNEKDKVVKLLSESLLSSTLDKMVKGFLSSKDITQSAFPYLYKLQQEDPDVHAAYERIIQ